MLKKGHGSEKKDIFFRLYNVVIRERAEKEEIRLL